MLPILLVHLGPAKPRYLHDCVHQIRLWNPDPDTVPIYLILDPQASTDPFFTDLTTVRIVSTDSLQTSALHQEWRKQQPFDTSFGSGYWTFVKERFFYIQELLEREKIEEAIHMEYDILVYANLPSLWATVKASAPGMIRYVLDNQYRGHPGFIFLPSVAAYTQFLRHFVDLHSEYSNGTDIQFLAKVWNEYPTLVRALPVLPEGFVNGPRISPNGCITCENPIFLQTDAKEIQVLFDSAVIGHAIGGIDPRNTPGSKIGSYVNESALYTFEELGFHWKKNRTSRLWTPYAGPMPIATIHMHSKALSCFLSDRYEYPKADWEIDDILPYLLPY